MNRLAGSGAREKHGTRNFLVNASMRGTSKAGEGSNGLDGSVSEFTSAWLRILSGYRTPEEASDSGATWAGVAEFEAECVF